MKCPKCKKQLSAQVEFCGYCGAVIPKKKERFKIFLTFLILTALIGAVLGFLTARRIINLEELLPEAIKEWLKLIYEMCQ